MSSQINETLSNSNINSKKIKKSTKNGESFSPKFSKNSDPFKSTKWSLRSSQITGSQGEVVFKMDEVEVPESWSQLATDIVVSKYFRKAGVPNTETEVSVKQLVKRIAKTIRSSGEKQKSYFKSKKDAEAFEKELSYILIHQMGAFNSPVWFNLGLYEEYGIKGTAGNFCWNEKANKIELLDHSYVRPQCSACFIQSVEDDLMDIFELAKKEARLFKYGSGSGTNFSNIRSKYENLSGGGKSSGLISFLEVLDKGAGATKSGGTTRRAAKMVCLDMDHPEIEDFVEWKMKEERKVQALIDAGYSSDYNGEAYKTVAGQNSNNSVRVNDDFFKSLELDKMWSMTSRINGEVLRTIPAKELWHKVANAAWNCADPGVQFDSTIQNWHTCPESGKINGSNPCSEYMFLDNTACNLSSINLIKFIDENNIFDVESYRHAARILFTAQEILVDHSSYPTKIIAENSHKYRPLGLGFANLGTLLMLKGISYDSDEGRAWAGALTAVLTGEAYKTSSEMAKNKGAFKGYSKNSTSMLKVISQHKNAVQDIDQSLIPKELFQQAQEVWAEAEALGRQHGFRNAQATVLAPTGTIGLLMDCDTTGVEPDFSLVKFKKLAGGGYFKIINQSVPRALEQLGYTKKEITEIVRYAVGSMSLSDSPHINTDSLKAKGFTEKDLKNIEESLQSAFDLSSVFSSWVLGEETLKRLKVPLGESTLEFLGFTEHEILESHQHICGRMMIEGAPYLKEEHLSIFDCANKCGSEGQRFLSPMSHIKMMSAVQPFLSGAISKTVNLPNESTVEEIKDLYYKSWKMGLKAVAIYRDGSKLSQPLSSKSGMKTTADGESFSKEDIENAIHQALELAPAKRHKLPQKRSGMTIEARVGGNKLYMRTGEYDDGRLGEVFFDMHKEGATFRSLLNCFAISVSLGLQYGVPLKEYVDKFIFTRFEPAGLVDHPNIKQATSILDYVFRVLGMEYLGETGYVHVKPDHPISVKGQMELPMNKAIVPEKNATEKITEVSSDEAMDHQLSSMMGDAPMCNECGHVTVRNGSCYRCLNCGNSMGCS